MKKSHILLLLCLLIVAVSAFLPEKDASKPLAPLTSVDSILYVETPDTLPRIDKAYTGFNVSFNPKMHLPNYVAWQLTTDKATANNTDRKSSRFMADYDVEGCATTDDYRRSGYDRGHMAPAGDMKWSQEAMDDCHYLTNIIPQDKYVNGRPWATVEKQCRQWAQKYGDIYIVAGPVLSDYMPLSIGKTPVPVPERIFKVIVAPHANPPRGIAFLMPNHQFDGGAQATVTTIDHIEQITGFDFFHFLPEKLQQDIESQQSLASWTH